jgi:hypothetical protein
MIDHDILRETSRYNIHYAHPGNTDRSAMPIGNGDLALSVWTTKTGIHFYIAKSDAQTEYDRNVKLGKVSIAIEPNLFEQYESFSQTLDLIHGRIRITAFDAENSVEIDIMVDTGCNNIVVEGHFSKPSSMKATYVNWRKERSARKYPDWDITESADHVKIHNHGILFYHQNDCSMIPKTAELEGIGDAVHRIPDTIQGRIFGGFMKMEGGQIGNDWELQRTNTLDARILLACDSCIEPSTDHWTGRILSQINLSGDIDSVRGRVSAFWQEYFSTSWVFVNGDRPGTPTVQPNILEHCKESTEYRCEGTSAVTRSYLLTKWMFACCSNGEFPVHYNGMLFHLMPGMGRHYEVSNFGECFTCPPDGEPDGILNPDERSWCVENLWQNLRHPFHSMAARGEIHRMNVLFRYINRFSDINRVRAKRYYQADGQYNNEMTTTFGLQTPEIYGLDRRGKPDGYTENRAGAAVDISPGLEYVQLMLEYYHYTLDTAFLNQELMPYLVDLLRYIETRFTMRDHGKMVLQPLHCVETYRGDVRDPITVVAGLIACIDGIEQVNAAIENREDYQYVHQYRQQVPELLIETQDDLSVLKPAALYTDNRENVECPELYSVFPFRLYGVGKEDLDIAQNTFQQCVETSGCYRPFVIGETPGSPSYSGWQFIGTSAALLGMTKEAQEILIANCALSNPGCRFPAMWGPIYDAVPDMDHGANILNQLQWMLFQVDGDVIRLLPSWPREWDVCFKFHAPQNTTVDVTYRNGIIEKLEVVPSHRASDIVIHRGDNDRNLFRCDVATVACAALTSAPSRKGGDGSI